MAQHGHGHHGHGGQMTPEQQRQMIEQELRLAKNLGQIKHKIIVMSGYDKVRARDTRNSAIAAINFPITSCMGVTGAVRRSWSVFCFFSSLHIRIVITGIRRIIAMSIILKI